MSGSPATMRTRGTATASSTKSKSSPNTAKTMIFPVIRFIKTTDFRVQISSALDFWMMIGDIEAGLVNMVIVKDMSRFGRNYLEVGLYTELHWTRA